MTQEHLCVLLNVSLNHLAKVETGNRCCSIELLKELSACLNVKTDYGHRHPDGEAQPCPRAGDRQSVRRDPVPLVGCGDPEDERIGEFG